jgi:hypothetical protein
MKRFISAAVLVTALTIGPLSASAGGNHHGHGGIGTGAALALGLGAFALGAGAYGAYRTYPYYWPSYTYPVSPYAYGYPYQPPPRSCWTGYQWVLC